MEKPQVRSLPSKQGHQLLHDPVMANDPDLVSVLVPIHHVVNKFFGLAAAPRLWFQPGEWVASQGTALEIDIAQDIVFGLLAR